MTQYLQFHVLTSFGPSNANRDDLGRHKEAVIGGTTRLRHSSQSRKRAIRESALFSDNFGIENKGVRTRNIYNDIVSNLLDSHPGEEKKAKTIAEKIATLFGKLENPEKKGIQSSALVFISPLEREAIYREADRLFEEDNIKDVSDNELKDNIFKYSDGGVDIALFGRMLAADPTFNRDAAVQVSHAFTTHATTSQDDFFSASDDLVADGAGHIAEASFGSGVFYQYACLNIDKLIENLDGNVKLAERAVAVLTKALTESTPSGKQNSFANHPRAYYMLVESGKNTPRDLSEIGRAHV